MQNKVKVYDFLPVGTILAEKEKYYEPIQVPKMLEDLIVLTTTLFDRLTQAKEIVHKTSKSLHNFFFDGDIEILKKISMHEECPERKFVEKLITENSISYYDQPARKIDVLLNFPVFEHYDRRACSTLTKWMDLNERRLSTVKNQQIFMPFPKDFNDIFDSQLRFDSKTGQLLLKKYSTNSRITDNGIDVIPINGRKEHLINFWQHQVNSTNICCFSLLDPMSFNSNHMWGLYGNSGAGVAFQYDIKQVIEFFLKQSGVIEKNTLTSIGMSSNRSIVPLDYCRCLSVKYLAEKNNYEWFQRFVESGIDEKKRFELMYEFLTTKHKEWEHEKEVRIISAHYPSLIVRERDHPLNPRNYFEYDDADLKYQQSMVDYYKKYAALSFIKPSRIIFGWNSLLNNQYNSQLKAWAEQERIEYFCLDNTIDYSTNLWSLKSLN